MSDLDQTSSDSDLRTRLEDMRDFCEGASGGHPVRPHPNNVARLCRAVLDHLNSDPVPEYFFRLGFRAGAKHGIDYHDMGQIEIDGETHEDKAWREYQE